MKERERSRYFQEIAEHFLKARGLPFFLSSMDIDLIATWEKMGIPLRVVLEGMEKAFESQRLKRGEKGQIRSLAFCKFYVLKAFEQYRERRVGSQRRKEEKDGKRKRIRDEVQHFLRSVPPELAYLEEVFRRAQRILLRRDINQEELEQLEGEVEELLFRHSPPPQKEKAREEVLREFPSAGKDETDSLVTIKLIKKLREVYRIPHLSFFYY